VFPAGLEVKAGSEGNPEAHKWIIICISFVSFMVSVDGYAVNISLPTIAHYFKTGTGEVSWVVLSYLLAVTSTLLIFGKLGDKIGFKKVFLLGFVIFTLASLLCGISPNIYFLIFARCLQGIGGSMLLGMAPAMITRYLPADKRGSAFGFYATFAALGITMGTPLGGLITGFVSWHWIFFINVPVGIAAIYICWLVLPGGESLEEREGGFDFIGAFLCLTGCLSLLYALNRGSDVKWTNPLIPACLGASAVLWILFVIWESRARYPLINLNLFRNRAFAFGNLACLSAFAFQAGSNFLLPFYLISLKGLKSEEAGFVVLSYSIVYMVLGLVAGRISDKISPRALCTAAMIAGSASAFFFAFTLRLPGIWQVFVFNVGFAASYAFFVPSNNKAVLEMSPEGAQGIASGILRTVIYLSLTSGVCIFETIFNGISGISQTGLHLMSRQGPAVSGFSSAYLVGGLMCLVSMLFSLAAGLQKRSMPS